MILTSIWRVTHLFSGRHTQHSPTYLNLLFVRTADSNVAGYIMACQPRDFEKAIPLAVVYYYQHHFQDLLSVRCGAEGDNGLWKLQCSSVMKQHKIINYPA